MKEIVYSTFQVHKGNFQNTKWVENRIELKEGQILLRIDRFSFTANNITYALLGESFRYWNFFPGEVDFGIIPVWGFATIIESNHEALKVGERFYGYYPTATHAILAPGKVRTTGFSDISAHRKDLSAVYNFYSNVNFDSIYSPDTENFQAVFRPLFSTSFLLEDFLFDHQNFGTKQIVITSASSKTALALAFLLKERKKETMLNIEVIGITSSKNIDFLKGTKYFDDVKDYDSAASLTSIDTVIIDFAGNKELLSKLKQSLNDKIKYISLVGLSQWDQVIKGEDDSGGKTFFAPAQMKKRSREWGIEKLQTELNRKFHLFLPDANKWIHFNQFDFLKQFQSCYIDTLNGNKEPENGNIVTYLNGLS